MLLAIDSGNTNIVFGLYDGLKKLGQWRLKNDSQRTADEMIVFLNQWVDRAGCDIAEIEDAIISSVVPDTLFNLKTMINTHFVNPPIVVGEDEFDLGVSVKIDNPRALGADRLVNTYGGYRLYGGPLIIIDFGTATSFDTIDHEGSYVGGVIAPGVHLSLQALYEAAAKLPPTVFARTANIIGKSTTNAMQSGTYWGYVGMIEGLSSRITKEYTTSHSGGKPTIVATGGLASIFAQDLPLIKHVNESLTLDSLALIYKQTIAN